MNNGLLGQVIEISRQAGEASMEVYESHDFEVEIKDDDRHSPVTKADKLANRIIEEGLRGISKYPIVSEEGSHDTGGQDMFWLVDPIDGTRQFLMHNGEFTINIALVKDKVPFMGVVYAPAKDMMYWGSPDGAYKQVANGSPEKIEASFKGGVPIVATSHGHMNEDMQAFLDKLGEHEVVGMGSSLKLCLVAEGTATVYPRYVPTSLWDTAAADAIIRAAGGTVTNLQGEPLVYDPAKEILNPYFLATVRGKNYQSIA